MRLFRPFAAERFLQALPDTVKNARGDDRTQSRRRWRPFCLQKSALFTRRPGRRHPSTPSRICGGRYGLSSKEFTPAMVMGLFEHLQSVTLKPQFTLGIRDDVTQRSLPWEPQQDIESDSVNRALFCRPRRRWHRQQ